MVNIPSTKSAWGFVCNLQSHPPSRSFKVINPHKKIITRRRFCVMNLLYLFSGDSCGKLTSRTRTVCCSCQKKAISNDFWHSCHSSLFLSTASSLGYMDNSEFIVVVLLSFFLIFCILYSLNSHLHTVSYDNNIYDIISFVEHKRWYFDKWLFYKYCKVLYHIHSTAIYRSTLHP